MQLSKRKFLSLAGAGAAVLVFGCGKSAAAKTRYAVTYSDAEWQKRLSPAAYRVLRREDTERPYTSPLNGESARAYLSALVVTSGCLPLLPSLKAERAGQVSMRHWPAA
jgi:hypothetical protein